MSQTEGDRRDVIEQPIADDLDVSGWELRKALRLLRKSNPPLLKWLKSPVVYRHDPVFAAEFGAQADRRRTRRRAAGLSAHAFHRGRTAEARSAQRALRRPGEVEELNGYFLRYALAAA